MKYMLIFVLGMFLLEPDIRGFATNLLGDELRRIIAFILIGLSFMIFLLTR